MFLYRVKLKITTYHKISLHCCPPSFVPRANPFCRPLLYRQTCDQNAMQRLVLECVTNIATDLRTDDTREGLGASICSGDCGRGGVYIAISSNLKAPSWTDYGIIQPWCLRMNDIIFTKHWVMFKQQQQKTLKTLKTNVNLQGLPWLACVAGAVSF